MGSHMKNIIRKGCGGMKKGMKKGEQMVKHYNRKGNQLKTQGQWETMKKVQD